MILTHTGLFKNDMKNGYGKATVAPVDSPSSPIEITEGTWVDNKLHGVCMQFNTKDCTFFEGMFVKGKKNGAGVMKTLEGKMIEGLWKDNHLVQDWTEIKNRKS